LKLLDAPHAGTGSCSHATAGPTRRGRRALLALGTCVLAVALGAAPAAAGPPGGASPDGDRETAGRDEATAPRTPAAPVAPRIARVRCVRRCAAPRTVNPGGSVRVVGTGLRRVTKVVFHGGTGATDDVSARARPQSDRSVLVAVPRRAATGALSAVSSRGLRSAPGPAVTIASSSPPADSEDESGTDDDSDAPASAPAAPGRLVFPVRGSHTFGEAGARFGASRGSRAHEGQDVMASCGTPLVAAAGGTVSHNRFHGLAGNYLVIDGPGFDYVYMHLSAPSPLPVGTPVRAGVPIGTVGATGNARGCHLHFEVWTDPGYRKGGQAIDPLPLLRRAGG